MVGDTFAPLPPNQVRYQATLITEILHYFVYLEIDGVSPGSTLIQILEVPYQTGLSTEYIVLHREKIGRMTGIESATTGIPPLLFVLN